MSMFDEKDTGVQEGGMVFNLEEVDEKSAGFEAMPKGEYEAIVDDIDYGLSSTGNPMMTFKFKLTEGDYAKRVLFMHAVMNNKFGLATLKKALINLGAEVDWANFNPQTFADQGDAIGLPIRLVVGIQKYNGEKRNNVKDTKPSAEGSGFMD